MSYLAKTPEDLLPCPHCGGEAKFKEYKPTVSGVAICTGCGARSPICRGDHTGGWKKHAAEAWNRRAERTCRDTDHDTESITCSECGEITRETLFWVDVDGGETVKGHRPRFCSNCGARLVDA